MYNFEIKFLCSFIILPRSFSFEFRWDTTKLLSAQFKELWFFYKSIRRRHKKLKRRQKKVESKLENSSNVFYIFLRMAKEFSWINDFFVFVGRQHLLLVCFIFTHVSRVIQSTCFCFPSLHEVWFFKAIHPNSIVHCVHVDAWS